MNYLFAKLRIQGKQNKYRKILSTEEDVFPIFIESSISAIPYSPETLLDENEWYRLDKFAGKDYSLDVINFQMDSVDYKTLDRKEFENIDFIFYETDGALYFQNVGRTKLISKKKIIFYSEEYKYIDNSIDIIIKDTPDAIYARKSDTLYFKNLSSITGIFKKISQLYKEATEEETSKFLQHDFISLENGFCASQVSAANRKRIAMAEDILNSFDFSGKKDIFSYITEYCPDLRKNENAFRVGDDKQLKLLLYGIGERFYTTPVSGEQYIANSVIRMDGKA